MKKRRFYAVIGFVIMVSVIVGMTRPFTGSAARSVEVLNPLGEIDPVYNQPLADRTWDDFNGKSIALLYYAKALSPQALRAAENLLLSEYPSAEFTEYNLGSSIGAKPLNYYDILAKYDAVVIGIADCTLSAWWGAYHAKMIEERGTPTVLVTHDLFVDAHTAGGLDNGFTSARIAVLNRSVYSRALTVLSNTDVNYLEEAFAAPAGNNAAVYEQIKTALTGALTQEEKSPAEITLNQLVGWETGNPAARMLPVSFSSDEVIAAQEFNETAMELGFGDGLPLIMPLPELVDEMLAATTRKPTDVLGKIMPRGGIMTVEKVAVNAVMAGARPEYFPAILAAMEAYASSWEDANLLYHALTSSDNYSIMLLFSGPIVEELGISGQWGFIGSGNEASNAIGRAVRLSVRNIGINRTNVTDGTARQGRQNDHALTVFGEEEGLLPQGWERHNEMLGFERNQSTVSVLGYHAQDMYFGMGGVNAEFVPLNLISSAAVKAGTANISIVTIPRNAAVLLQKGLATVNGGAATIGSGAAVKNKTDLLTRMGYSGGNQHLVFPVVVGDPESARVYTGGVSTYGMAAAKFYGMQAFQTRLITGAVKIESGTDSQTPGEPRNVKVSYKNGSAVLSWDAPSGAGSGLKYQYTRTGGAAGGMSNPKGFLPDTGSPTPPNAPASASAVPPQLAGAYNLGAWPLQAGSYDPAIDTVRGIPAGTHMFGLFTSNYAAVPIPQAVTGYTRVYSFSEFEPGTWLALSDIPDFISNGFDYILIMGGTSAPLVYSPAPFDSGEPYEFFPSWIDVPEGEMSVTIPNVNKDDIIYNDFWVRAIDDSVKNAVEISEGNTNAGKVFQPPAELTSAGAFMVGTWPMPPGTYDPGLDSAGIQSGTIIYGLFSSDYTMLPAPAALTGFTKVGSIGELTINPPTWYLLNASSGYSYVLIGSDGEMPSALIQLDTGASGRGAWARAKVK